MKRLLAVTTLAMALVAFSTLSAAAVTNLPSVWSATYVAAFQPQFGNQGVPYSGLLKLKSNHGVITGTYESTSVRPDPMSGRIINVTGNTSGGSISLHFASFNLQNGTIDSHGTITGTANWQGRLWNFMAKVKSRP